MDSEDIKGKDKIYKMIIEQFAKERDYEYNKLVKFGWFEEDGKIKIKHSNNYIVIRESNGKTIKPEGKKYVPYFLSGTNDKIIIVEGQTDAVAVKLMFPDMNVFCIGGTSSYKVLSKLKYYYQGKKVILAFDNDEAGKTCTNNSIEFFLNHKEYSNIDIRILKWNEKIKDIDEYYRMYGKTDKLLDLEIFKTKSKSITYIGDFIEELKEITDQPIIVGKKIKCINPNHEDKTPSMHIYKDHAYCFVCGYHIKPKIKPKINEVSETNEVFSKAVGYFTDFKEMAKKFINIQPLFYDKSGIWWLWDYKISCYGMIDDTDLMNMIDEALPNYDTINSKTKNEIIESLKRVGRKHIPKEAPERWVQFKDKAISLRSGNIYDVTPDYFFTNPIPWEIGETADTPNLDRIFEEWVGKKYVKTLYEIIAYCCITDYPISRLFCFIGTGRNGKTKFLNVIEKLLGDNNKCSTELDDLLDSRFEKAKLYRKLVCLMGETNFKMLEKTSILKKLCGGDLIGFEFKNKTPFDARNYAKIIISTNSLPTTTDKTDGFYRRWMIIDFPNQFTEDKDILKEIPELEYNCLCKKIIEILPELIKTRKFTNEGTYEERMKRYEEKSNPLSMFIKKNCEVNVNNETPFFEFYDLYLPFLIENGFRNQSKREVSKNLRNEGFDIEQKTVNGKTWKFILGLSPNSVISQISVFPLNSPVGDLSGNTDISVISVISDLKVDYDNFIPIYKIEEECNKKDINDFNLEIEKLKKSGTIAEYRVGKISIIT